MNKILEINKKDFYARVEPGVICMQLNTVLAKEGLMFPPNPGSEIVATIGGMVSTNASGHRAVKYGTTKDYIKGLKVVLADGSIIETGGITPKTSLGYDLTRLFCAAEGTLGIITEIICKLEQKPEYGALATGGLRGRECGRRRGHRGDDLRASSSPAARSWTSSASRSWRRPWARM